jgi:hypothetical protein
MRFTLAAVIVLGIAFGACSGDPKELLVGRWQMEPESLKRLVDAGTADLRVQRENIARGPSDQIQRSALDSLDAAIARRETLAPQDFASMTLDFFSNGSAAYSITDVIIPGLGAGSYAITWVADDGRLKIDGRAGEGDLKVSGLIGVNRFTADRSTLTINETRWKRVP